MPRRPGLLPGIVALGLLLAACSGSGSPTAKASPTPTPTPSPAATSSIGSGNAPWALDLDFSGDLTAHVTGTAPSDDTIHNECTGADSARLGSWASTMAVNLGGQRYSLVVVVKGYKGAGTFTSSSTSVVVSSGDPSRVWQNGGDDAVTFTVGADEQAGQLNATLSNASAPTQKLTVVGHWSCRP
jgi:hypothetical protein